MLCPNNKVGTPANERFTSFKNFFENNGFEIDVKNFPLSFSSQLKLLWFLFGNKSDYIFISQPPFRFWMIFLFPFLKVILDIRDGWGIAIKTGYGGNIKPNWFKYLLVSFVENIMYARSNIIITCTYGLKKYISRKTKKNVLFIPNGISLKNRLVIDSIKDKRSLDGDTLIFSCVGQFSEYGEDKVKIIINNIAKRYLNKTSIIQVVGADENKNSWLKEYVKNYENIEYKYISRVDKLEMYSLLKSSDFALVVIRDPDYDYGTKIFDYIACDLKVVNYFTESNEFTDYFNQYLDSKVLVENKYEIQSILREENFKELNIVLLGNNK